MSRRFMFPKVKQFRKTVAETFLMVTREIYKHHPYYTYDDDEHKTKIMIDLSYADRRHDGKNPSFVIKVGSYNKDLTDTLTSNMSKAIKSDDGAVIGYERRKIIRLPITVIVHSYSLEESEDMSDELSDLCLVFNKTMYSQRGIVPVGVHVSETDVFDTDQVIYQTTVAFTVDVPWVYSEIDYQEVDDIDISLTQGLDGCDDGNSIYDELEYRVPGVEVYREKIKKEYEKYRK